MATILSFLSGRQITNSNGVPQSGALLYHYQAGTTTNLTVYSNQAGTTPHAQPVVCDSGGFVPLIYIDDASDWKVVIQTALAVTLQTYDNLPAAEVETSTSSFASPLVTWNQVTSSSSPVTLLAANAGNAYEADTTSGSIEFDLPSAASVGNGKGFIFKKTASANSMIIDPSGSETIDDVSTSVTITNKDAVLGIFSNGAEWYRTFDALITVPTIQRFTSGTAQTYTPAANIRAIRVRMVGGGGGGAAQATNNGTNGTASSFGTWTADFGDGALVAGSAGGAGGTGGTDGTGTLIARFSGQDGGSGHTGAGISGGGGSTVFGGGAPARFLNDSAGVAAKANTGSGGSGGNGAAAGSASGAGGAAEYVEFYMTAAQVGASQTYTVGAAGAGGAAGTRAGGNGAAGIIIVEEYY
jgi:hypothetical protein